MSAQSDKQAVLRHMLSMSAADISMLGTVFKKPGNGITTMPGSANDQLWSQMERLGWLISAKQAIPFDSGQAPLVSHLYAVTPAGSQPIAELLTAYREVRSRLDERMAALANGLCRDFNVQLVRRVREEGGNPRDVLALLSIVIGAALRKCFKPEDRERAAGVLFDEVTRRLA